MSANTLALLTVPPAVQEVLSRYAGDILRAFPGSRIVLFGSYAKGNFTYQSDIDVAVMMPQCYEKEDQRAIFRILCRLSRSYDYDIQPQLFSFTEYRDPVGIMEEIVRYGIDISHICNHN
ncbi:MAG: nucleotidyltransferase domain-containing protein [Clostridia bacterium]|nr:nucleotidyltransferase domain-containing protein [Clostridia bacterium]